MIRQTNWRQCRIKTGLCLAQSLKVFKFDQSLFGFFFSKKWHCLLGETVGDACSTGPGSKQCTGSDGVERAGMGIGRGSADFRWKRKMSAPKHKTVHSNQNVMVLHQVKNWKMQGCFMQFLRLVFVKKLQLRPLTPTRSLLRPPDPHFSADFSILNSHA